MRYIAPPKGMHDEPDQLSIVGGAEQGKKVQAPADDDVYLGEPGSEQVFTPTRKPEPIPTPTEPAPESMPTPAEELEELEELEDFQVTLADTA